MMTTKEQILNLVEDISDENVLEHVFEALNYIKVSKNSSIWDNLSASQKVAVNRSYEQSKNPEKLIQEQDVKNRLSKWL